MNDKPFEIIIDSVELRKIELKLGNQFQKAPTAISRALNRAVGHMKTVADKETRDRYHVKREDILGNKKEGKEKKSSNLFVRKASKDNLNAKIVIISYRIPLDHFKVLKLKPSHKNPPKSIKVAVAKTGLKELHHAFVANVYNKKGEAAASLLWERTRKYKRKTTGLEVATKGRNAGRRTEIIRRIMGPSVSELVGGQKVRPIVEKAGYETYQERLDHEIKWILERNQ